MFAVMMTSHIIGLEAIASKKDEHCGITNTAVQSLITLSAGFSVIKAKN